MAWVKIKGSNEKYQYGNTAPGRSTYKNSARGDNSVIADGIRTYTKPGTNQTTETYIRCRETNTKKEVGELSKTYYDSKI